MSIARHHTEWLSLVPVSGPFLSLPVLLEAFSAGLEPHDPDHVRLLRQEYDEWRVMGDGGRVIPRDRHNAFIRFILQETLDLPDNLLLQGQSISQTLQVEIPEHGELLRPDFVLVSPPSGSGSPATHHAPRLLIQTYSRSQDLSSYVSGSTWKASPDTRMTELLHGTGVRLGLVTNGEHWMLVDAPKGETSGYASWYASLWLDEPITLRAFRSLLSVQRFFGVPDDQTLESLLAKSASNQQEVTDQLGYQVRKAVEVLIHSLDKADQDFGRELLADVTPEQLYESALTVMMRLVFLFCAEERELIPSKPFPVYEQNYSVCTISRQLRELADQHGEELLERRYDAWRRLLAAFRAVYGGLKHDDVQIPAYGGNLFNPDRFPFLEGRKRGTCWRDVHASPLPVNNRTVLHLLEALQMLQIKVPGGGTAEARRLSFRAIDIEQIGHVYEGLLDHTARRATEPVLGLVGTRDKEPEVPLAKLEQLLAKGEADLVRFLKDETGKSDSALKKSLKAELDSHDAARFRTACQSDNDLWKRVEPLAGLVRTDSFGYPVVVPKGSVFVTAGDARKVTATHYTPRNITERIVRFTLEPLVYVGPADGRPKGEWRLKPAKALLELKICDMACGSGAFLVQAARYMAERLLEAWDEAKKANPNTPGITPEGSPSTGKTNEALIPDDPAERKTYAMRIIAQRCLYGVDVNPLAVEMAKLSLWLLTVSKDKPFEFLDHCIRCGDSLVGLVSLDQLRDFSIDPASLGATLFKGPLDSAVDEAISLRLKLEELPANTLDDVQRQEKLLIDANEKIARLRCAADLLVAAEFWGENAKERLERVRHAAVKSGHYVENGPTGEFEQVATKERRGQIMFHWPLEFPEVVVKRGGFDAFVGNPPYINAIEGGMNDYLKRWLSNVSHHLKGTADYSYHFLSHCHTLANSSGSIGLLLPRPFLNATSAKKLRLVLSATRPPHLLFTPNVSSLFTFANVHVVAVVLANTKTCSGGLGSEPEPLTIAGENWWSSLSRTVATDCTSDSMRLVDAFDVAASMTTQIAYDIQPYLEDRNDSKWPRLVTTGLIDPHRCLWGVEKCRYLKRDYLHPVIRPDKSLPSRVTKRLSTTSRPKLLVAGVAGPGFRLEAFFDTEGRYCGAVSTYTILHQDDNLVALEALCTFLNSDAVAEQVRNVLGGASMGSGLLTIKKEFLQDLVVPVVS